MESHISFIDKVYATSAVVTLCTFFFFEGGATNSWIKIIVMGMAPMVFLFRCAYISQALILGFSYWLWCYFSSLFTADQRFSTLGFLGMYIITFITYYGMLQRDVFTFDYFKRLLRALLIAFGTVLVMQQLCLLMGIRTMPIANLNNQFFLSLTKLPSITLEPSHTARIMAVLALCYWRMHELEYGEKPTLKGLFSGELKWPMILFLWAMLTMGSGTAFISLGILMLYFLTKQTAAYVLPLMVVAYIAAGAMEITQFERANRFAQATLSGDVEQMQEADGSGASRFIPVVNTLTKTDLTKAKTWIGHGTAKIDSLWWLKTNQKIGVIEQYGIVGFIISMLFVYLCAIHRFFSIETLLFLILFGMSIGNIYYTWGCLMLMAGVNYFQKLNEMGVLVIEEKCFNDEE